MRHRSWISHTILLGTLLLAVRAGAGELSGSSSVVVVRDAGWSQGDASRAGAAEFIILMEIARLQHAGTGGGLVAVGDRRGLFSAGAEAALARAVLGGVPVVKLAARGRVVADPAGLFLDGGALSADAAQAVLAQCLRKYGAWPARREVTPELRERLRLYQQEFTLADSTRLAAR